MFPVEGEGIAPAYNVLGAELRVCEANVRGTGIGTGFYRDGHCSTGPEDHGTHAVCIEATDEFLRFSATVGNPLGTPMPQYMFPGLQHGDCWCLCAERWVQAKRAGMAPKLLLLATHEKMLQYATMDELREYALDLAETDAKEEGLSDSRAALEKLLGLEFSSPPSNSDCEGAPPPPPELEEAGRRRLMREQVPPRVSLPGAGAGDLVIASTAGAAPAPGAPQAGAVDSCPPPTAEHEWFARWQRTVGCWFVALPMPTQTQLGSCVGALGLHLAQRFDAALGKPPTAAAATAEPGCEWLGDANSLELPGFPDMSGVEFTLPPLPRLLPQWQQLGWVQAQQREWHQARIALAEANGNAAVWTDAAAGAAVGFGAVALVAVVALGINRARKARGRLQVIAGSGNVSRKSRGDALPARASGMFWSS